MNNTFGFPLAPCGASGMTRLETASGAGKLARSGATVVATHCRPEARQGHDHSNPSGRNREHAIRRRQIRTGWRAPARQKRFRPLRAHQRRDERHRIIGTRGIAGRIGIELGRLAARKALNPPYRARQTMRHSAWGCGRHARHSRRRCREALTFCASRPAPVSVSTTKLKRIGLLGHKQRLICAGGKRARAGPPPRAATRHWRA